MRNLTFRAIFAGIQTAGVLMAVSQPARADWAPTHKVEFVIPFEPGGGADILARTLIRTIEEEKLVPVPIVAVNRAGGGAAVGVS
jgi:putative tricarboxylic transport membrane protein